MIRKTTSRAALALLIVSIATLIGCTDVLTYSKDSENHGMTLYKQGNYADACGAYRNAARQNPRDFKAYYMMGNCYQQLGQHQQAISSYRTSLDVQATTLAGKDDPAQRYTTIDALAQAIAGSDTRDTEINAAEARANSTQQADDALLLAVIYADRSDPDSAITAFDRAALLGPNNFYVAKEYGLYLEKLGQRARAETSLRHAYALNQKDPAVIDGLRRLGVVPGPSLKAEKDLVPPPLPKGPLPEFDSDTIGGRKPTQPMPTMPETANPSTAAPTPAPPSGPRD